MPVLPLEIGLYLMNMPNIKNNKFIILKLVLSLLFISCFLISCSSAKKTGQESGHISTPIVWPSHPETAKIRYEGIIEKPDDIASNKGFFRRALEFLLGKSADRIIKPYGLALDSKGRLIVVDAGLKRLHIFDITEGKYLLIDEYGDGGFASPIGVAVDNEDNIYVSEPELNKVVAFNKKGKYLFEIKDKLHRPTGVAIDKIDGLLYVVNTGSHNISVFERNGKYLNSFGERGADIGQFNFPTDISIDDKGFIYVTDSMNFRIQIFDKSRRFLSAFGRHGDGSGSFARPKGVSVDSEGHIYVVDALFDAVQIFDREGRILLNFGSTGQGKGEFWLPSGIVVDGNDKIYVSDSFNKRIQVFKYIQ